MNVARIINISLFKTKVSLYFQSDFTEKAKKTELGTGNDNADWLFWLLHKTSA